MNFLEIKKYKAPLPFPQKVKNLEIIEKEGAYLSFSKNDQTVIGDISPFPGFSKFKLEELLDLFKVEWEKDQLTSTKNPHLEFLKFQISNGPMKGNIDRLKVNSLHQAKDLNSLKIPSDLLLNEGHEEVCLKIKAQSQLERDEVLAFIREAQFENIKGGLRIDSNGTWEVSTLLEFYQQVSEALSKSSWLSLDYFEEPLKDFKHYDEIKDTQIPIALEESLPQFLKQPSSFNPAAIVVKPSQQGISVLTHLKEKNLRIILSSAFESPMALEGLKCLAEDYPQEFHGLGASLSLEKMYWI